MSAKNIHNEKEIEDYLFMLTDSPFGQDYKSWTNDWWNWLVGKPNDKNPAKDPSGKHSDSNNLRRKDVFFLAGEMEGHARRRVSISSKQAILFPVVTYEWSLFEMLGFVDKSKVGALLSGTFSITNAQKNQLKEFTKEFLDYMYSLDVIIDEGKESQLRLYTGQLCQFRVDSDFEIIFPPRNIFNTKDGKSPACSDGYWVFIKPNVFKRGEHTIWFSGVTQYYRTEAHYTIKIV
jgi:hypothetical protein